jgi:REP element-mobilizing transposase RayT
MPRRARIDAPGALHHIICRGIERRKIFWSDSDREDFIKRLETTLGATETACYAWALLPNHFHLLLRTGNIPIAQVMRKLLSGYVGRFNRAHRRSGHLFQNRYKSILCQEEPYLLELVRYIHLNPLRAKQVASLKQLDGYRYSGHSAVMGKRPNDWQATDAVLRLFAKTRSTARWQYRDFVEQGMALGRRPELTGGGLIRSHGGWGAVKSMRWRREHVKSDERILGDSDFVQSVLSAQNEQLQARYLMQSRGYDFQYALRRVSQLSGLEAEQILKAGKQPARLYARSLLCYWAIRSLGMTAVAVSKLLGISQSAATRASYRGETIAAANHLKLVEELKE